MKRTLLKAMNKTLGPLGLRVERADVEERIPIADLLDVNEPGLAPDQREIRAVRNVLRYTTGSGSPYSALTFPAGYHSIELGGEVLRGQRDPKSRLEGVPYDFTGKSLLDLGCNQGGMVHALADKVRVGVGLDYDPHMINAANRVKAFRKTQHLHFFTFDLQEEPLDFLPNYLDGAVDIVFLLSVAMWIRNWREVIARAAVLAPAMLFESNGSEEQQTEQEAELRKTYSKVLMLRDSSPDDPIQGRRRLYLCER